MKLFPVLIKELLDKEKSRGETNPTDVPPPAALPPLESKEVLAEIPDVTDSPERAESLGGETSPRPGGRLFTPSLSARILLGGGILLFFIAAMPPIFFRSHSPSDHAKSSSAGEGFQPPAPTASEAPKWTDPTRIPPTAAPAASAQQATPSKTSPSTPPKDAFQQTTQATGPSPGKGGLPQRQVSGALPAQFQEESVPSAASAFQHDEQRIASGNFPEPRPSGPYCPTSTNYPHSSNPQMVYYPSTDGNWYPVAFPPGKPSREAPVDSSGPPAPDRMAGRRSLGGDSAPYSPSGGYPSTGYGPWNEYREASHREVNVPERDSAYGTDPHLPARPNGDRIPRAYPAVQNPPYPQGNPPGSYAPQPQIPHESPGATRYPDRDMSWVGNLPRSEFPGAGTASPWSPGLRGEEPGVARFKGTIEKPTVRSAYDGTGSSLY